MSEFFQKYIQKIQKATKGGSSHAIGQNIRSDWHIMLGIAALTLTCLFIVGAYIFITTSQETQIEKQDMEEYKPPVSEVELLSVALSLRERTNVFYELQKKSPIAPDPGALRQADIQTAQNAPEAELDEEETDELQ